MLMQRRQEILRDRQALSVVFLVLSSQLSSSSVVQHAVSALRVVEQAVTMAVQVVLVLHARLRRMLTTSAMSGKRLGTMH